MRIFIGDYPTVPLVFIDGNFIGGYDDFIEISKKIIQEVKKSIKPEYQNKENKFENLAKVNIKQSYDANKEKLEKELQKLSKKKD